MLDIDYSSKRSLRLSGGNGGTKRVGTQEKQSDPLATRFLTSFDDAVSHLWKFEDRASLAAQDDVLWALGFIAEGIYGERDYVAQLLQDAFVVMVMDQKRHGQFVEIGVGNGFYLSNSLVLERDLGWTGVLAEANPVFVNEIRTNRPSTPLVAMAILDEAKGAQQFRHVRNFPELSSLETFARNDHHNRDNFEKYEVETQGVLEMLRAANIGRDVDYVSIDVEGPELIILQKMLADDYRPKVMTIEHNRNQTRREQMIAALGADYKIVLPAASKWDLWAVRCDVAEDVGKRLRANHLSRSRLNWLPRIFSKL